MNVKEDIPLPKPKPVTPCGYPAGNLQASDGTQYWVEKNGQIRRLDGRKLSKAEKKRIRRSRRNK